MVLSGDLWELNTVVDLFKRQALAFGIDAWRLEFPVGRGLDTGERIFTVTLSDQIPFSLSCWWSSVRSLLARRCNPAERPWYRIWRRFLSVRGIRNYNGVLPLDFRRQIDDRKSQPLHHTLRVPEVLSWVLIHREESHSKGPTFGRVLILLLKDLTGSFNLPPSPRGSSR